MGFSSQEYWSGLLFPTPGIFHIKGLNQSLLHLLYWQVYFLSLAPLEKPLRFSSVQFSSVTQSCPTLFDPMDHSMPGLPVHHQLLELAQTHVHQVSDAIQPSHPLSSPSPPAFHLSQHQGLFEWVSVQCIKWPKYCSFSFSISPSDEYSGLISCRIDWFDLLPVQGTFKNLLQYHSAKASILWLSAFFMVQLSHLYMTTGKTITLTRWTFVGKVMSLLFNPLSGFVIAFLPGSKRLLLSWLQSPSAVILDLALPKEGPAQHSKFFPNPGWHLTLK